MSEDEVIALIRESFPDSEVVVQINGNSFMIRIISEVFNGLNSLKRQQRVYACINDKIKSGEMHAVTMRLFTKAEWEQEKKFSL